MKQKGFTLIELLVVIAIIAILAAILFPVFAKAREKARQTSCLSNQKQITTAAMMWSQDNNETFPLYNSFWTNMALSQKVCQCLTAGSSVQNAYVYNNQLSGLPLGSQTITDPTTFFLSADGLATSYPAVPNVAFVSTDIAYRHQSGTTAGTIASYVDGHVALTTSPIAVFNSIGNPAAVTSAVWTQPATLVQQTNVNAGALPINLTSVGTYGWAFWGRSQAGYATPVVKGGASPAVMQFSNLNYNGVTTSNGFWNWTWNSWTTNEYYGMTWTTSDSADATAAPAQPIFPRLSVVGNTESFTVSVDPTGKSHDLRTYIVWGASGAHQLQFAISTQITSSASTLQSYTSPVEQPGNGGTLVVDTIYSSTLATDTLTFTLTISPGSGQSDAMAGIAGAAVVQ
jgi:prepilin-type N-terminal cleavage/methylation domain-containing protein